MIQKRPGFVIAILIGLGIAAWLVKQSLAPHSGLLDTGQYAEDNGVVYLNTAPGVAYVGMDACADCHPTIYNSYLDAEMGRSMERLTPDNIIEQFPQQQAVYDSSRNYHYEMVRKGDRFFQREFREDESGRVIHERLVEAQYIMGSGNNLRMYFHNENGMLYELPLTWYVHEKKWDMSPGYRDYINLRFSRFASKKCITCHNSYLKPVAVSENRYAEPFALGIGCERCHGPGELHVRNKRDKLATADEDARTIVNPRKLSFERQLDVCRQCHLQGKAWALQPGKGWFDFRPGRLLASHRSVYYPKRTHKQVFEVADSAQRLAMSKCFTQSGGGMTCITCHDPHRSIKTFSPQHYNDKCMTCHEAASLSRIDDNGSHARTGDCITCHMNRTGTDKTLHGVSTTDHWIRIGATETDIDWTILKLPDSEKPRVTLTPEVDADDDAADLRKAIAYLDYYQERDSRKVYLDSSLAYLARARQQNSNEFVFYETRGDVQRELGQPDSAIPDYERAVELAPGLARLHYKIGKANLALARHQVAVANLRRALQLKPRVPEYLESLASALVELGRPAEAIDALQQALQIDAQNPYAFYRLGNLYVFERNDPRTALDYFERAVQLDPDLPNGFINLGNTYAMLERYDDAIKAYHKELSMRPNSAFAAMNLGRIYALQGSVAQAKSALERALSIDPSLKMAKQMLDELRNL